MNAQITDQAQLEQAVKDGKVDERNMTEVLNSCITDLIGASNVEISPNAELVDLYLTVEKNVTPIPWIDTSKCPLLEINKKVLTSQKTRNQERLKLAKIKFPEEEISAVLDSCKQQYEVYLAAAKKKGHQYVQKDNFLLSWIKPEEDHGCLVTEIDGHYNHIYSIATDIPTTLSQRYRDTHFKSVTSLLLNALPVNILTRRLEFAYLVVRERLCIFVRLQ
jgi:hypothetical protein